MTLTHQLTREEFALISATRESAMPPLAVMLGTVNGFKQDNTNKRWNAVIEIWDRHIEDFLEEDESL